LEKSGGISVMIGGPQGRRNGFDFSKSGQKGGDGHRADLRVQETSIVPRRWDFGWRSGWG